MTEPSVMILANYGFADNDPLFLTAGASNCAGFNCGTVYWGDLGSGNNGLGVQNDMLDPMAPGAPTIDGNEALIFIWGDTSVFANDLSLSFYGLGEQVRIAGIFAGSDGSGYDFNESVTLSGTSTLYLKTMQEAAGHNLLALAVYANSGDDAFGVTALDTSVPEPGSALLLTTGLAIGLLWARKHRHARV